MCSSLPSTYVCGTKCPRDKRLEDRGGEKERRREGGLLRGRRDEGLIAEYNIGVRE